MNGGDYVFLENELNISVNTSGVEIAWKLLFDTGVYDILFWAIQFALLIFNNMTYAPNNIKTLRL